ncbi:MAG TPA: hypothetical protein VF297_21130 [Pyrinomonadaceae bacterium]
MAGERPKTKLGTVAYSVGERLARLLSLSYKNKTDTARAEHKTKNKKYRPQTKEQITLPSTPSTREQRRREALAKRKQEQRQLKRRRSKGRKLLIGLVSSTVVVLGAVSSLIGINVYFSSRLTVSSASPLNLSDPFSTFFIVSNDGALAVYDVRFWCKYNHIKYAAIAEFKEGGSFDVTRDVGKIEAGDKASVPCIPPGYVKAPLTKADVSIGVSFQPSFIPWRIQRGFRFVGERDPDDVLHWFPQPLQKPIETPPPRYGR